MCFTFHYKYGSKHRVWLEICTETPVNLDVKYPLFWSDSNQNWLVSTNLSKTPLYQFKENPFKDCRVVACGHMDGQTDMAKLNGAFFKLFVTNAPSYEVASCVSFTISNVHQRSLEIRWSELLKKLIRSFKLYSISYWQRLDCCNRAKTNLCEHMFIVVIRLNINVLKG
jgi:hypothetical protein